MPWNVEVPQVAGSCHTFFGNDLGHTFMKHVYTNHDERLHAEKVFFIEVPNLPHQDNETQSGE